MSPLRPAISSLRFFFFFPFSGCLTGVVPRLKFLIFSNQNWKWKKKIIHRKTPERRTGINISINMYFFGIVIGDKWLHPGRLSSFYVMNFSFLFKKILWRANFLLAFFHLSNWILPSTIEINFKIFDKFLIIFLDFKRNSIGVVGNVQSNSFRSQLSSFSFRFPLPPLPLAENVVQASWTPGLNLL